MAGKLICRICGRDFTTPLTVLGWTDTQRIHRQAHEAEVARLAFRIVEEVATGRPVNGGVIHRAQECLERAKALEGGDLIEYVKENE